MLIAKTLLSRNLPSSLATQFTAGSTWAAISQLMLLHAVNRDTTDRSLTAAVNLGGSDLYLFYQTPMPSASVLSVPCFLPLANTRVLKAAGDVAAKLDLTVSGYAGVTMDARTLGVSNVGTVQTDVLIAGTTWPAGVHVAWVHVCNKLATEQWVSLSLDQGAGSGSLMYQNVIGALSFLSFSLPLFLATGQKLQVQAQTANALDLVVGGYATM